jgi:8-oxo-dGTP diphosphatase
MKMGIGCGVMILRDNKILLGQRHFDPAKADSEMHGEGTWTMPGGKLEFGESFETAAVREVFEETGLQISEDDLKVMSLSNNVIPGVHFVTVGMMCEKVNGEPKVMEPDEITQWQWFSLDQLPSPVFFPSEKILRNYKEGILYRK